MIKKLTQMNRIDEILEKYFSGISSLAEEQELKSYFNSRVISPKHQKFSYIFDAFEKEKDMCYIHNDIQTIRRVSYRSRFLYAISGIAAACIIILTIAQFQSKSEDYLILNGKRINDSERAREFANAKLEKSLNVIHRSLDAYKNNKVVADKLNQIENQLK